MISESGNLSKLLDAPAATMGSTYARSRKCTAATASSDDDDETEGHPMDGRLWMVQGKREKTLSPADIKTILADVDESDPPYGYILAASTTFSKKSYDTFRNILREKGVMEFYIWGSAELEDMLHLPKNDRILVHIFWYFSRQQTAIARN